MGMWTMDVYAPLAVAGSHHTRIRGERRQAPDEAAGQGSKAEDAWFAGEDEEDYVGMVDPLNFDKMEEQLVDELAKEEAVRRKEAQDMAPWFLEVCCGLEWNLAVEFHARGLRVTRCTDDLHLESDEANKVVKEAEAQARAGGLVFVWWSLPC